MAQNEDLYPGIFGWLINPVAAAATTGTLGAYEGYREGRREGESYQQAVASGFGQGAIAIGDTPEALAWQARSTYQGARSAYQGTPERLWGQVGMAQGQTAEERALGFTRLLMVGGLVVGGLWLLDRATSRSVQTAVTARQAFK